MPHKDPLVYKRYMKDYRARKSAERVEYTRLWRLANPERALQIRLNHKARVRYGRTGDIDIEKLVKEWDRICGICNLLVEGKYEVDHIIPLIKGGPHEQSNLQLVHPRCNHIKGAQ